MTTLESIQTKVKTFKKELSVTIIKEHGQVLFKHIDDFTDSDNHSLRVVNDYLITKLGLMY